MIRTLAAPADAQTPFDAAVVLPTVLRPSLARAVRSVFAQDLAGRIQLLVGIDVARGEPALLEALARECPPHIMLTVCALPYSTSVRHGGLYPNRFSGALRSILTLAANSPFVACLDDDNWWAPDHLSSLLAAIGGRGWAFSRRILVEAATAEPVCEDDWESVGPGAGVFADKFGGFVDPSSLMIDKLRCHDVVGLWSLAAFEDGTGEDRLVFQALNERHPWGATGRATSYYTMAERDQMHPVRLQMIAERGILLPSQRRAGVRSLAEAVAALPRGAGPGEPAEPPSRLLFEVLDRLKPREIVALGTGAAASALTLAALAEAIGLSALVVASDRWTPAGLDDVVARLGAAAVALPPALGTAFLAGQRVAVDLVHLDPPADPALLAAAWSLLRPGGLLLGRGPATPAAAALARAQGVELVPAELEGAACWLMQKG